MITLSDDEARLLQYANRFGADGKWLVNQEDAIPSLARLQELDFIERSECGYRWRLITGELSCESTP